MEKGGYGTIESNIKTVERQSDETKGTRYFLAVMEPKISISCLEKLGSIWRY
jgi:hypothetical protein